MFNNALMRNYLPIILSSLLATLGWGQEATPKAPSGPVKSPPPRVIISTDFPPLDVIPVKGVKKGDPPEKCSDPDDVQSMVRFLLYANEFDVEGLIASAGTFANVARKQNILDIL
ncbi:MAG: nucleoside hydrolase-like domain-containing protein, partial [Verrucomicrobiia bacterium]